MTTPVTLTPGDFWVQTIFTGGFNSQYEVIITDSSSSLKWKLSSQNTFLSFPVPGIKLSGVVVQLINVNSPPQCGLIYSNSVSVTGLPSLH